MPLSQGRRYGYRCHQGLQEARDLCGTEALPQKGMLSYIELSTVFVVVLDESLLCLIHVTCEVSDSRWPSVPSPNLSTPGKEC